MNRIGKQDVVNYVINGEFDIAASVKPDKDSDEQKNVTLRFRLVDTPLSEVIASALKDKRINWQTSARNKFESIRDKSVVLVDFKGGRSQVDPENAVAAKLASMSEAERENYIKNLLAKAQGR
jgi:curli biogenesis system outer membrane secretion channel CsgG